MAPPASPKTVHSCPSTRRACSPMGPARSYPPAFPTHEFEVSKASNSLDVKSGTETKADSHHRCHVPFHRIAVADQT